MHFENICYFSSDGEIEDPLEKSPSIQSGTLDFVGTGEKTYDYNQFNRIEQTNSDYNYISISRHRDQSNSARYQLSKKNGKVQHNIKKSSVYEDPFYISIEKCSDITSLFGSENLLSEDSEQTRNQTTIPTKPLQTRLINSNELFPSQKRFSSLNRVEALSDLSSFNGSLYRITEKIEQLPFPEDIYLTIEPEDFPNTRVLKLKETASDMNQKTKVLKRARFAKKSIILLSFLAMNLLFSSLIFMIPFYAYVWLLSISNLVRSVCIISVLYSWTNTFLKKQFDTALISPQLDTSKKRLLFILPCYTESESELSRTLDSMMAQKGEHQTILLVIVDGQNIGKGNAIPTFKICEKLLDCPKDSSEQFSYQSWKAKPINVFCKRGTIRNSNIPYILMVKEANAGKKDSLIIVRELVLSYNGGKNRNLSALGNWFESAMFEFGVSYIDYISGTDADTIISPNAMDIMIKKMMTNAELIGLSGNVKIDLTVNSPFSPWTAYQYFEYMYGQVLTRSSQGVFGKITCLPGCIQIFSANPKLVDEALDQFKLLPPENSLFHNVLAFLGEDRRFTCLLLYLNPRYKTDIVLDAYGTTAVPDSFKVFFSQRRRWFLSSQANNCLDTISADLPIFIRIIAAAQILASAITPFVFIAIICAIIRISAASGRYYLLILGTSSLVWSFKLFMILFGSISFIDFGVLLYGLVLHTFFGAFVQTYNIVHALSSMDDLGWGLTRQIEIPIKE